MGESKAIVPGAGGGAAGKGVLGKIGVGIVVKLSRVSRQQGRVCGQLGSGQAQACSAWPSTWATGLLTAWRH